MFPTDFSSEEPSRDIADVREKSDGVLYVPSVMEVIAMAPRLCIWADMAAHAYGLYSGLNAAIGSAEDKSTDAAGHAHHLRQELAMMALLRVFAVFDRPARVSFQAISRFLKAHADASERLAAAQGCPTVPAYIPEAVGRFSEIYGRLDPGVLGRLQSFRNGRLAHASISEVTRTITFGELEVLVRLAAALAHQTNLMTAGLNNDPVEHLNNAQEEADEFWTYALSAAAKAEGAEG